MTFKIKNKVERKIKVEEFNYKYGSGKAKLSKLQKEARIEKILGTESNKVLGIGKNKNKGVELLSKHIGKLHFDKNNFKDNIPVEVLDSINDYPNWNSVEKDKEKFKILNVNVKDNGESEILVLELNGKERDLRHRSTYSLLCLSDEELAIGEMSQKKKGILKEVSDRTMIIHEENGDLDALLDDPDIDTDEDKPMQY